MVLSGEPRKKSPVTPPGIDSGTVRLVTQCLNHYATGPIYILFLNFSTVQIMCYVIMYQFFVWPLWVRVPESLPTKAVNCVVLCIVCV